MTPTPIERLTSILCLALTAPSPFWSLVAGSAADELVEDEKISPTDVEVCKVMALATAYPEVSSEIAENLSPGWN